MWDREYEDYPNDSYVKREVDKTPPGGGCEMQELFGWGLTRHRKQKTPGTLAAIFYWLFGKRT
jgi:hypothetical protein